MKKEKQILDEVDKTLKAFDHLPELEANPFLFTRIKAKLDSYSEHNESYLLQRLKIKSLALSLIIFLNIITVFYFFNNDSSEYKKNQLIYALEEDYNSTQEDFNGL